MRVPYSPFFLQPVRDGHVAEITSKGPAIQGMFKQPQSYGDEKPTTRFKTEIPESANRDSLSERRQSKGVTINAEPLSALRRTEGRELCDSALIIVSCPVVS